MPTLRWLGFFIIGCMLGLLLMSPYLIDEKGDDTIMYTKGIKKIFVVRDAGMPLDRVIIMATEAGFRALAFNGVIYIKSVDCWVDTVFHLTDFSDAND